MIKFVFFIIRNPEIPLSYFSSVQLLINIVHRELNFFKTQTETHCRFSEILNLDGCLDTKIKAS